MLAIVERLSWKSLDKGFSCKLTYSKVSQVLISSTSISANDKDFFKFSFYAVTFGFGFSFWYFVMVSRSLVQVPMFKLYNSLILSTPAILKNIELINCLFQLESICFTFLILKPLKKVMHQFLSALRHQLIQTIDGL